MPQPYRTPTGLWDLDALRAARTAGLTLATIAAAAGVTRERIRQVLVRAAARAALGLPPPRYTPSNSVDTFTNG